MEFNRLRRANYMEQHYNPYYHRPPMGRSYFMPGLFHRSFNMSQTFNREESEANERPVQNGDISGRGHLDEEKSEKEESKHQSNGHVTAHKDDMEMAKTDWRDAVLSKQTTLPRLPPIGKTQNGHIILQPDFKSQNEEPNMKVGIDNTGFTGEVTENSVSKTPDPDVDDHPGPADDAPVKFDPKKPPLAFCSFIVRHHKLAFFLTLGGHFFFMLVSAILMVSGYDLIPIYFEGVPLNINDDNTYLRMLAWINREEDDSILRTNTSASIVGERTKNGDIVQIFYKSSNVLTKSKLEAINDLEIELTSKAAWAQYCKQDAGNIQAGCSKPMSLIRFFDGTLDPSLNDTTFSNISGTLYTALQMASLKPTVEALVSKTAVITPTDAVSDLTRTFLFTGLPLAGGDLSKDSRKDQMEDIQDFLVDNFRGKLVDLAEDGLAGMTTYFYSFQILLHDIFKQVIFDMLLAVGSFTFIFLFMLFQTRSLFLTFFSIASILTSFLGANLIYRVIFDFRYFGIFHVLSIFIILGIGADNIFVFNDTWRATAHEKHANMEERLSSCYRRASKSMFITSLTTFAAFISNAFSPLLGVNTFGIFSSILVMVNFVSAIVFFPTVVIMYHKKWEEWSWPCFRPCSNSRIYPCAKPDPSKTGHRPNSAVRFFKGPFHLAVTHKVTRWVFIVVSTVTVAVFMYFASQIEISKNGIQLYKKGNTYYEAAELNKNAFKENLDDRNVKVVISFGLKNQNLDDCHKTDFECDGKTVWDNSFDLNPKPAQTGLMELCNKIKNLQGHEELLLQRDPSTNLVNIKCFIEAMNDYIQLDGHDATVYSPTLNLSLPTSEIKFLDFFDQRADLYNQSVVKGDFYRYFETIKSYWLHNGYRGSFTPDYGTYSVMLGEALDKFDTATILSDSDEYYGTRLKYAAIEVETSLVIGNEDYETGLKIHDAWEDFVTQEMKNLPSSAQGVQFTPDEAWHEFKRQKALAESAVQGIIIGVSLSFVVLTIATTNIIISAMATVTIILVTATITGSIPMLGWEISVIESINLSLVVGLAVDYVVHLSESYHHSAHHDRVSKVKDMLEAMGVSVVSGAFSTLGAAAFMMGAEIQFFLQFGIFMFCTIGFSLFYSLCLFTPLLGLMGPQGSFGSIVPLVKWIWYKIIGRKKIDETCGQCKGKGFYNPGELQQVS